MTKEVIDFFDGNGNFVLTAAKNTKNNENSHLYIKGVYIFIINNKNEILIQRKREDHRKLNRWEIPSGHVDSKESYEEAAKRELKEETGITVPLKHIKTIKIERPNELDAFYIGYSNLLPNPKDNPEVDAFEFISFDKLISEIKNNNRIFAPQLVKFLKDHGQECEYYLEKMMVKNIFIDGSHGKISAAFNLFNNDNPLIILVHGFNATKKNKVIMSLDSCLSEMKISTLKIDLYNHGESEGEFEDMTVIKCIDSVFDTINYAKSKFKGKIGLFATSMGALVSMMAVSKNPVDFLLLRSPVVQKQGDIIVNFHKLDQKKWKKEGIAKWDNKFGFKTKLKYNFYEDAQKYSALEIASKLNMPTLIFHGNTDDFVPFEGSEKLNKLLKDSTFYTLPGATHFYKEEEIDFMNKKIILFLKERNFINNN